MKSSLKGENCFLKLTAKMFDFLELKRNCAPVQVFTTLKVPSCRNLDAFGLLSLDSYVRNFPHIQTYTNTWLGLESNFI